MVFIVPFYINIPRHQITKFGVSGQKEGVNGY